MWWLAACAPEPSGAPPIILVSLDTFRADRVGERTPNLQAFAEEAIVFSKAYAQANETCFSHASLFTSRYPSELGRLDANFRLPPDVPTLAEMLKANGYATAAMVGGAYLSPAFGFDRGFGKYDPTVDWGTLWHTVPKALTWYDARDSFQPFFLFIHGYDAHARYLKPTPWGYLHADAAYSGATAETVRETDGTLLIAGSQLAGDVMPMERLSRTRVRFRPTDVEAGGVPLDDAAIEHVRKVYDGAVAYADAWFGRLMAAFATRGLLDRAWIVVISDHGEDLGEGGAFNHRFSLDPHVVHVPLMMRPPGGGHREVAHPVALLDILPTFAELAGAMPPAAIQGRSLLSGAARSVVFSEGAFRLVSAQSAKGGLTFAGLGTDNPWLPTVMEAAPVTGPGFSSWGDADRADLRGQLVAWRRGLTVATGTDAPLPADTVEALRTRGYWETAP